VISDTDIDRALSYLRDNAEKDGQARAERLYLEQWIKTVLAQEQAKSQGQSVAASEIEARTSTAYIQALQAYRIAIAEDERRRFLRSAAEAKIEAWRTMCSNARAEGKAYS